MTTATRATRKPRVNPDTIKTHWTYSLAYGESDRPRRSGMSGGADTLPEALARAFQDVTYYLGMGYVVRMEMWRACSRCDGVGKVQVAKFRQKTCPSCKGIKTFDRIPETLLSPGSNVTITTY